MSEERVLCSNFLTIQFDQLENNRVVWHFLLDDDLQRTQSYDLSDLAQSGAPLSALGIRALWKLCIDGLIYNALEQANTIQVEVNKRLVSRLAQAELELAPEGVTIN
jgi:ribosomal 50S subunit-associated protein YjgA (DUF615 family)